MLIPLLRACGVEKALGGRSLFRGFDIEVWPGDAVLLTGPNGSGKSTMLNALAGEISSDAGFVEMDGRNVGDWSPFEREERCPHLDQIPLIELDVPAVDNLVDVVTLGASLVAWVGTRRRTVRRRLLDEIQTTAREFGLFDALLSPARELSYGQRRLLAILRVLRPRKNRAPRVLLLDEPLAGLGKDKCEAVVGALQRRLAEGWSIVVAEHVGTIREIGFSGVIQFPIADGQHNPSRP
jgi:ABC-type branched-subunit amino acid transport system ATPase component